MPDDFRGIDSQKSALDISRAQDFSDQQNELAGRDVGKMSRFLPDGINGNTQAEKAKRQQQFITALGLLMQDAVYKDAYNQTLQVLNDTETQLHDALTLSAEKLHTAEKALRDAHLSGASTDEMRRLKREYDTLKDRHDILIGYDTELMAIRNHMQNTSNPPSKDELEHYQDRMQEIRSDMSANINKDAEMQVSEPEDTIDLDLSGLSLPTL